jgi:hypothetical protein
MATIKIPPPISGGVMLSYKCQARCRHCIYACSPDWKADWISEENLEIGLAALSTTIQPSTFGEHFVGLSDGLHFTGGEPFLNFKLLLRATEIATAHHIPSTFVETNSVWCIDDDSAWFKLDQLKKAGLTGIMISVNPFYAEYVPFERTERCIRVSQQIFGSHNTIVYQMEFYQQFKRLGIRDAIPLEDYLQLARDNRLTGQTEMFFMGRATTSLKSMYPTQPASRFLSTPCRPPFLRSWHNHFDNYGNFMPGFCGGISLGSWFNLDETLQEGIDLKKFPILRFLIAEDMRGLFHFAKDLGYEESPDGYLSKCDLCLDIRKHLVKQGDFAELQPRVFYDHVGV